MFTAIFWRDALERALKSLAQAIILAIGADHIFNLFQADLLDLGGIGLGGFALSLLTSMGSYQFGNSGTASLTKAVEPAPTAVEPPAANEPPPLP